MKYIDKDQLIDVIEAAIRIMENHGVDMLAAHVPLALIKSIPTCDVSVKHGHWMGGEYDGYADGYPAYDTFICSICGAEEREQRAYCPDCGAIMDAMDEKEE